MGPETAHEDPSGVTAGDPPRLFPAEGEQASRLIVARHGETHWSRERRHTGRSDVPLDARGRDQAEALGRHLAGHTFSSVLVSPLHRAAETCELAGLGLVAQRCDDLREWDYGEYEGRTTAEIRVSHPGWSVWSGPVRGGESLDDVVRRADRVVEAVRAEGGDVLAIAHAHILRVVTARWLGLEGSAGAAFVLGAGAVGVLGWEHGDPALLRWNQGETSPLS
jgi:probable phosphoglycerate mutase